MHPGIWARGVQGRESMQTLPIQGQMAVTEVERSVAAVEMLEAKAVLAAVRWVAGLGLPALLPQC